MTVGEIFLNEKIDKDWLQENMTGIYLVILGCCRVFKYHTLDNYMKNVMQFTSAKKKPLKA
jgi:predicted negative regulator of RcsB-dependent stress response